MSDLLITAMTPRLGSGTGLRTYGVVAALAQLGPVEVGYVQFGGAEPAAEYTALSGVTVSGTPASRGVRRAIAFGRALSRRVPIDLSRGVSAELVKMAGDAAPATRVIADGPVVAAALLGLAQRRPVIYLAHNLESAGFRGPAGHRALRRFERTVLMGFAESWMATQADRRGAEELVGVPLRTRLVPNVVDAAAIVPIAAPGSKRVLFVADFSYAPNAQAVAFAIREVMPALWRRAPEFRLRLVGRGLDLPDVDPRIEVAGFVDDLHAQYACSDVVLVPLLTGGGSPLKFIEGLAHGLPVVASDHAAALIEGGRPGQDFLVASEPEDYAAAILRAAREPALMTSLGANGRELVLRRYSVQALVGALADGPQAAEPG